MLSLVPIVTQRNEITNNTKIYTYVKEYFKKKQSFIHFIKKKQG